MPAEKLGNRLAACRRAGVEPTYTSLNGNEPVAYILSANIRHRHLREGQRAMLVVVADAFLETRKTLASVTAETGLDKSRVSMARIVHKEAPDWVPRVISGADGLDAAYAEAPKRRFWRR